MAPKITNTLRYAPEACISCGMCALVCPHGVFEADGRTATPVRAEACMECGACALNCPSGAITVDAGVGCSWAMIRTALLGRAKNECCGVDDA